MSKTNTKAAKVVQKEEPVKEEKKKVAVKAVKEPIVVEKEKPAKKVAATKQKEVQETKKSDKEQQKARKQAHHEEIDEEGSDDEETVEVPQKKTKLEKGKEKVITKSKKEEATSEKKTKQVNKKSASENTEEVAEKTQNKPKKAKADRFAKTDKDLDNSQRGILYVGHIPYGFVEEGLKEYFNQYGEILNIQLARSKKTARSMGYAFIEFKYKEVAKIAAESMNGYMLYGKQLVCRVIEDNDNIKVKSKKFKYIPYNKLFIEEKNKDKNAQEMKKEVNSLLKHEEKKRKKLAELKIDYEFPGFKGVLAEAK